MTRPKKINQKLTVLSGLLLIYFSLIAATIIQQVNAVSSEKKHIINGIAIKQDSTLKVSRAV